MGGVLFIIDISENELGLVSEVHHHFWFEFELMRMMMRVINGRSIRAKRSGCFSTDL